MYAPDMKVTKLQCPLCDTFVCFSCREEWHDEPSCEAAFIKKLGIQDQSKRISFCPMCKLKIQKNEGCNHMTCGVCKYEWCWICGGDHFLPHCGGQGAGGAGRGRVLPPPARPPGFIESQHIERDEWIIISLIAIAIFVFM